METKKGWIHMITCFISYAHEDGHHFSMRLSKALTDRKINSWVDTKEMFPGQSIKKRIEEGINQESDVFLFVIAPGTLKSKYCMDFELNAAWEQSNHNGMPIIPVFLKDCIIPECLNEIIYADFRNESYFEASVDHLVKGIRKLVSRGINSPDQDRRIKAVRMIGKLGYKEDIYLLKDRYENEKTSPKVRFWIATALGEIGGDDSIKVLSEFMGDNDVYARKGVTDSLERFGTDVIKHLMGQLCSSNPLVKDSAKTVIKALVNANPEEAKLKVIESLLK
jgi:hypothetical protein